MGKKKRQLDFQKTKLRVGRQLPKGGNVTDTSFKSKQIITPDQRLTHEDKSLSALLKLLDTKASAVKIDSMTKIIDYVTKNKETLYLTFPDILSKLGKVLLESDPTVTSQAVSLLSTCVKNLSTQQYQSFSNYMVMHLSCMMSHGAPSVKDNSLVLLDELLKAHQSVVGKSPKILMNLLNMVSTASKVSMKRKLDEVISSKRTSMQWRLMVFHRMLKFFDTMMKKEESDDDAENENVVHWDGKTRLYMPIYETGLKPATLDYSWYGQEKRTGGEFAVFVCDVVPVLHDALRAEIPNAQQKKMVKNDVVLSPITINYLNTLLQILNHIAEWAAQNLNVKESKKGLELSSRLQEIVSILIKSGFPYAQHDAPIKGQKPDQSECEQLNLNICYLYAMCFLQAEELIEDELQGPVKEHLHDVFCASKGMSEKSILLIVKISKILMQSKLVDMAYKNVTLIGMFGVMENFPYFQQLTSFFVELSLDYDFQYLRSTEGMKNWFKVIFQKLDFMMNSDNLDLEFLKCVQQICVRRYPEFIGILNIIPHEFLFSLLKSDQEKLQLTAIDLILAMEYVPSEVLHGVLHCICGAGSIPQKISIRLIRLLHNRFVKLEVSPKEKLVFVKFLLNVACDTSFLEEPHPDFSEMDFTNMLFQSLSNTLFRIYPTEKWKTHSIIFEECYECLLDYIENELVVLGIMKFFHNILCNCYFTLPVHSVIALLKIRCKIGYLLRNNEVIHHLYCLMFSGLVYVSVLISDATKQEVEAYGVKELSELGALMSEPETGQMMRLCHQMIASFQLEIEYFHVFRVVLFLFQKQKLNTSDSYMHAFLKFLANKSAESKVLRPLWAKIYKCIE